MELSFSLTLGLTYLRQMTKLATKHYYVRVSNLKMASAFFREQLNLHVKPKSLKYFEGAIVFYSPTTRIFLSEKVHPEQTKEVNLYTEDCLEHYCRLKTKNVLFENEPHYLPSGLSVVFTDTDGNKYHLLESRKY